MDDFLAQFKALVSGSDQGIGGTVDRLIQAMEPEAGKLFRLCGIPHQVDWRILQVLNPSLTEENAKRLFQEFSGSSLMVFLEDSISFHDEVRPRLFQAWLKPEHEAEFQSVSRRLAGYFEKLTEAAEGAAKSSLASRAIFHLIGCDQDAGFKKIQERVTRLRHQYRFTECESMLSQAEEYGPVLSRENRAWLAYGMGKLAADNRQWDRASGFLSPVLEDEEGLNPALRIRLHNRMGMVHAGRHDWHQAIASYSTGLRLAESTPDLKTSVHRLLYNMGMAHLELGDWERASEYLNKSLESAQACRNTSGAATSHNGLGNLYSRIGDSAASIASYRNSLACLDQSEERFRKAQVLSNLGICYGDTQAWEESNSALSQSLEISRQAGDYHGQAMTLNNLARCARNRKDFSQALQLLEEAKGLLIKLNAAFDIAQISHHRAKVYKAMGNRDQAMKEYGDAIDAFSKLGEIGKADIAKEEFRHLNDDGLPPLAIFSIIATILIIAIVIYLLIDPLS